MLLGFYGSDKETAEQIKPPAYNSHSSHQMEETHSALRLMLKQIEKEVVNQILIQ